MQTKNPSPEEIAENLKATGYSLESTPATGIVRDDWQCIAYAVQVLKGGKLIWSGPFHLGLGHVKIPKTGQPWDLKIVLNADEQNALEVLRSRPMAKFHDKTVHPRLAAKLANRAKLTPTLADVLHSLVLDGSPFFDAESFEEWADNFGYGSDSIKAKSMFEQCMETGRALTRGLGAKEVDRLRELLSNL
jgi:hypothetical protein